MLKINNEMSKSSVNFFAIPNKSVMVHVCFVLFIVCLYICVCECLLQNNNHKTKHNNNNNCGSAFEPGASRLPYYCTSIYVRSGCTRRASCVDSKPKKKEQKPLHVLCIVVKYGSPLMFATTVFVKLSECVMVITHVRTTKARHVGIVRSVLAPRILTSSCFMP